MAMKLVVVAVTFLACFFLARGQNAQFASLRPDLPCGTNQTVTAFNLQYCTQLLGGAGTEVDAYYFGNWTIGNASVRGFENWAQNLIANFNPKASCSACLDWYKLYLCIAGMPGPGYSACYMQQWWKLLRANSRCQGACVNPPNTTCDSKLQCCPCQNITSDSCNAPPNEVFLPDDDDFACGPVAQEICVATFSTCLGDSFDPKLCAYWDPVQRSNLRSQNAVKVPRSSWPTSQTCPQEFRVAVTSGILLGTTGFPILQSKGCAPKWVTPSWQERVCYSSWLGSSCRYRTVYGRPYLTCGTSKMLLSLSTLAAAIFILFFIF